MTTDDILKEKIRIATLVVDRVLESGISLTVGLQEWYNRAMELRELGQVGLDLYHKLSQMDYNYSSKGTTANFRSALRHPNGSGGRVRTLMSFFHRCKEAGIEVPDLSGIRGHSEVCAPVPLAEKGEVCFIPACYQYCTESVRSHFCESLVATGILSEAEMAHAAKVYRIGARSDKSVIFWQIDEEGRTCDGKVMRYDEHCHRLRDGKEGVTWMSFLMKYRLRSHDGEPLLYPDWHGTHCLFGLHLLQGRDSRPVVAVVESEKTAVICSERLGKSGGVVWMATGGMSALTVESLRPLRGYRVVLFPDTDEKGECFARWSAVANSASKVLGQPFYVSPILEEHASDEQKRRKIDLADFVS